MKKNLKIYFSLFIVFAFIFSLYAGEKKTITKTFKVKKVVEIKTVSGDCIVKKGNGAKIQVTVDYNYNKDCFKPEFTEQGNKLIIKENFEDWSCSGKSEWTIIVPEETDIEMSSASGNLSLTGLKSKVIAKLASGDIYVKDSSGEFEIKTASGDIEVENLSGEIDFKTASGDIDADNLEGNISLKTASGMVDGSNLNGKIILKSASDDVEIENSKGNFILKSASGSVEAENIEITGASEFKTATGKVYVLLKKSSEYDLTLASATGDAVLNYNGNPIMGYFEFTAQKKLGNINSPFKFDKEEEFTQEGKVYFKKSFFKKNSTPKIYIKTAIGTAELREK